MPNFTVSALPTNYVDAETDIKSIKRWILSAVDELTYIFNNLDSTNVIEAAKVKAENIDTTNARIGNAQIGMLNAEKLKAGTIDTSLVKLSDSGGNLVISGSAISISDKNRTRFEAKFDRAANRFNFVLYNKSGGPTVSIDSSGDAHFGGVVEGSQIFSSTIVGTDSDSYTDTDGGVFAEINQKGIKVMQDKNYTRSQKIGMSVADNGTAYLVLGAGDGSGKKVINGVEYTNGAFKIEKDETHTSMGIVGSSPFINFWDSGELWLDGSTVKINGVNVLAKLNSLSSEIDAIKQKLNSSTSQSTNE